MLKELNEHVYRFLRHVSKNGAPKFFCNVSNLAH